MHKSEGEVAQSCPTPRDPMDCSLQSSSIHRIFLARVLEWSAIAFSTNTVYKSIYVEFRKRVMMVCKTTKETQMYRTVFWTLWERAKVG